MSRRMTKWVTDVGRGLGVGIGLIAFITVVDLLLLWLAAEMVPRAGGVSWVASGGAFVIGLALLLSLVPLGLMVYWLYGLTHSAYLLDRNELIIRWGTTEQIVPVGQIELVLTGDEIVERVKFRGGGWPGHYVGYGEVRIPDAGLTSALFYATAPPQDQIYVVTPGLVYGISPADREDFLESLRERMEMGPTQVVEQSSRRPGFLGWEIWQDRLGMALLAGSSLALLVLIGLLSFRFPSLDRLIPLHFDAAGNADRLGPRIQVFTTPLIGLLTLLLNGLLGGVAYRRERMVSHLLWGGAALIQLLVWVATLRLLGRM